MRNMNLGEFKQLLANAPDDTDISQYLSTPQEKQILVFPEMATEIPVHSFVANIKHSCNLGDIVSSLPAVKKYYDATKRKVNYVQRIGMKAAYYQGAVHGTVDETGEMVTLNKPLFDMIKPLLESQEYIERMEVYNGQHVDIDFDVIRGKTFVNMPHGSIQAWLFYAFPDLNYDISKPWIFLPPEKHQIESVTAGKVIVNFTERYRNGVLDYFFLREYAPDLIFAGTEIEHFKFCTQWQLNIPRLEIKDFLELAYAIRGARFLFSNQSFQWNLASGLGTPRVLEVCQYAQNCLPFYGDNSVGYFHQAGAPYYFRKMYNLTK